MYQEGICRIQELRYVLVIWQKTCLDERPMSLKVWSLIMTGEWLDLHDTKPG